ncbi:PAS domain-containing protein [Campylobacter corcagiensis]|uniref:PAS domain-containing protein n=1 Tax=Campylobacter corcagiensis TaxID=1448857 RepID=A0A7M1LHE6_9BACT|nr:PAS domain-containing protein [Campylobacter corcagiensis]QKF65417.1 PAS sensor-containing signal transduction protein [Campylobacter corcagiensis]QOQ88007.1 PAS domain-containing protein [Campylobacter corcagiensis]
MIRPTPIDEMINLDKDRYFISSTDTKGIITSANPYFKGISGYSAEELLGQPHSIIRHPDMPRVIFKIMWERIQAGENMAAVVKNLAKDGRYYWVVTDFDILRDDKGDIKGYVAYRKAAPHDTIQAVIPIYKKLLEVEATGGMEASQIELTNILKSMKMRYTDFIEGEIKRSGFLRSVARKLFGKW